MIERALALLRTPELRRFLIAGGCITLLSFSLYVLFDRWLPYALAYMLAYAIGMVVQFLVSSRWVYRAQPDRAHALAFPLLHLVIASFGTVALWVIVAMTGWPSSWSGLAAIAAQTPVAFLLTRWWFASSAAPHRLLRLFELAGAALLLGVAALFVATALLTLADVGFRVPLWDQYRSYALLLESPFPLNVLQSENGHRPLLPNLLKLLDLWLDGGRQGVLLWSGAAFALACFALVGLAGWRERGSLLLRASVVLAAALALFWLGNARMLLHGNEAVAIYWVLGWLIVAASALAAGPGRPGSTWLAATALALGCFGFGNGPVIGCVVLLLAVLLRRPWTDLVRLGLVFGLVLLAYVALLPGAGTVRAPLALHPLQNVADALRWLAGSWIQAWLGLAEHPSGFMRTAFQQHGLGSALIASADWLTARTGAGAVPTQMYLALRLGGLGTVLLAVLSLGLWRGWLAPSRLRVLGLGLAWFALGTALLVALSRHDYFLQWPGQLFAERYLPWSCVFWLGLLLAALPGAAASLRSRVLAQVLVPLLVLGSAWVLWPSHQIWRGWAEIVDRHGRIFALALAQDESLPVLDSALAIPAEADSRRTVMLLRSAGADLLEPRCPAAVPEPAGTAQLQLAWTSTGDGLSSAALRRLEGHWPQPLPGAVVVAYDANGNCVGQGALSGFGVTGPSRWLGQRTGLDVLVRMEGLHPGEPLQLQLLDRSGRLQAVGSVPVPPLPPL